SGHMASDGLALGLALLATWMARFPVSERAPFGYRRVEILAALVNGAGLVAIALRIGWEAIVHLQQPPADILSLPMMITAGIGVMVNGINVIMLHQDSHHDLNLKGAFLHMVADMVGSLGVLLAAIAIWAFHWVWADGVVSLFVTVLIVMGTLPLLKQSVAILLEQTPSHLNLAAIRQCIHEIEGVASIEHLRVWTIAPGQEIVAVGVTVARDRGEDSGPYRDQLCQTIQILLNQRFGIHEVMVQINHTKPVMALEQSLLETIVSAKS
ncbi:MAG: cation diffusion facilitator family transporter, partial [Cyanobacteria bacterium]|nr:cation diffusion facilitator family transporter [Cyanobacteriota bacterium]MDW8203165.1 cation diffusion facilitator family transporter [Cyanobacteriota bacterium SKYGB_h_bin112]